MTERYILRVTAGSDYDVKSQVEVPVNSPEITKVSNKFGDFELNVRVQNYKGLPRNSPETSAYFSTAPHDKNQDQYSISLRFNLKDPYPSDTGASEGPDPADSSDLDDDEDDDTIDLPIKGVSAMDLQFGNDFDHPIRDRLPPGFNTAMSIVRWWIDPGLEGDAYADQPYLYGPALSSFNVVHVGEGEHDPEKGGLWFEEGGDEEGLEARRAIGAPDGAKERMKWALKKDSKERWVFEYGTTYGLDFFNPYLDFGDFSLRLPGLTLPIMKYWDGQGLRTKQPKRSHQLRYVLRNRSTNDTYLVVLFTLHLKEDVNENGSLKPGALAPNIPDTITVEGITDGAVEAEDPKALEEARRQFEEMDVAKAEVVETSVDDLD